MFIQKIVFQARDFVSLQSFFKKESWGEKKGKEKKKKSPRNRSRLGKVRKSDYAEKEGKWAGCVLLLEGVWEWG